MHLVLLLVTKAKEVFSSDWPWSRQHIGPPAGPSDTWEIKDGSLYLNYFDGPEKRFFANFSAMKAEADAHWTTLWGKIQAGPFNTECLANPGGKGPTGNSCVKHGESLPPVPSREQIILQ